MPSENRQTIQQYRFYRKKRLTVIRMVSKMIHLVLVYPNAFRREQITFCDFAVEDRKNIISISYSLLQTLATMELRPEGASREAFMARLYMRTVAKGLLDAVDDVDEKADQALFVLSEGKIPRYQGV